MKATSVLVGSGGSGQEEDDEDGLEVEQGIVKRKGTQKSLHQRGDRIGMEFYEPSFLELE